MKRRIKILAVLWLAVCPLLPVFGQIGAQRADVSQAMHGDRMMVSLVPVPLFFNGFRVDFDCRLKDNLWLQLAPQYNNKRKGALTKTDGFCMEANLRYYLKSASPRGFYVASGLGVDYNRIQDNLKQGFYQVNSTRFGGQLQVGYQFGLWSRAVLDLYVGAAFRYAVNKFPDQNSRTIMEAMEIKPWHYQFSGVFMEAGVRIGLLL